MATGMGNPGNPGNQPNKTEATGIQGQPPEAVSKTVNDVTDRAHEVVDKAAEGVKQTSANAAMQFQQAQRAMLDRATDVKSQAASQLYQAAETLRSEVRSGQGQPVQQAEALASSLDQLGHYLDQHSFDEIESDVRQTIQRNPWQSVGVAVAVGWVLSRIFAPRR